METTREVENVIEAARKWHRSRSYSQALRDSADADLVIALQRLDRAAASRPPATEEPELVKIRQRLDAQLDFMRENAARLTSLTEKIVAMPSYEGALRDVRHALGLSEHDDHEHVIETIRAFNAFVPALSAPEGTGKASSESCRHGSIRSECSNCAAGLDAPDIGPSSSTVKSNLEFIDVLVARDRAAAAAETPTAEERWIAMSELPGNPSSQRFTREEFIVAIREAEAAAERRGIEKALEVGDKRFRAEILNGAEADDAYSAAWSDVRALAHPVREEKA